MADRRRTINHHAKTNKRDRSRAYATGQIHRMTAALELPRFVGDRAKHLFRRAHETDLTGADLDTVAAACSLAACRESQLGRTASDFTDVARSEELAIKRRLRHLQRDLALELPPPDVRQRVRVVAGRLDGGSEARRDALAMLEDTATQNGAPSVVAASALYTAGDWTQREVCDAAGVTPAGERACRARLGIAE
jgi:transcription initiation factor TFIIIB Brf1 subunit/transcription initiation factor TFIIB